MKNTGKAITMLLCLVLLIGILQIPVKAADYYRTESKNEDYARAATAWGVTPLTVTETIGVLEQRFVTLCTSYWAEGGGYTDTPMTLEAKFTEGEGLLSFETYIGAGTLWDGAEAEVLIITPTAAASELTAAVTAAGTFSVYWCGAVVDMPFSITIDPAKEAPESVPAAEPENDGYYETQNGREDYARAATDWGVKPLTVTETLGVKEKMLISLCTSYWAADSGYGSQPEERTASFTSGEGLLRFETYIGAGTVWDGADCQVLIVRPTEAAEKLTESTLAEGTFAVYWCGSVIDMPFSITIDPSKTAPETEPATDPADEGFNEVANLNENYARAATEWGAAPLTLQETIHPNDRMSIVLCTAYWAEGSGYTGTPSTLQPVFTGGEELLNFDIFIGRGPIWDDTDCAVLRIWTDEQAQELTEAVTVSGTFPVFWCGAMVDMPFEIIIDPAGSHQEEGGLPSPLFIDNPVTQEEMEEGYDLRTDLAAVLDSWSDGKSALSISRLLYRGTEYGPQPLIAESDIARFPCVLDEADCEELKNCTAANAKVLMSKNGQLVNISFESRDGYVMMNVTLTEEGKKAAVPQVISGELFFESGLHATASVPFSFLLTEPAVEEKPRDIMTPILITEGVLLIAGAMGLVLLNNKKKQA